MLPYRDSRLTQIALAIFFLAVAAYAYFEIRGLLYGPHININFDKAEMSERFVIISGKTDHITSLSVDGAPVAVTTDGSFEVPRLLAPGINRIVFDAQDSYGHSTSKTIEIVYTPNNTSAHASSTTPLGTTNQQKTPPTPSVTENTTLTTSPNEPIFTTPSSPTTSTQ